MALFVANWKMYKTYDESIAFAQNYSKELAQLSSSKNKIILAPSFICLDAINKIVAGTNIGLCAQDCAPYASGPYTGEVDATSLAQVGCTYAIIGHSERRHYFHESNEIISQKIALTLANNITPIICIGETQKEFDNGVSLRSLELQISSIIDILKTSKKEFCIAYEPVWAIGTGKIPAKEDLTNTLNWLFDRINTPQCTILYGGSIDVANIQKLLQMPYLGGFLIGKASCDFQSLKKIVSLA